MINDHGPDRAARDSHEIRLNAIVDHCNRMGLFGTDGTWRDAEAMGYRTRDAHGKARGAGAGIDRVEPELHFRSLNSDVPTRGPEKRSWLKRLCRWYSPNSVEYDAA